MFQPLMCVLKELRGEAYKDPPPNVLLIDIIPSQAKIYALIQLDEGKLDLVDWNMVKLLSCLRFRPVAIGKDGRPLIQTMQ